MQTVDRLIQSGCDIGKNVVIDRHYGEVDVGEGVHMGHNVVIHGPAIIGRNAWIDDGSVLGRMPRSGAGSKRKAQHDLPPLEVGDDCVIGVHAILYQGTKIGNKVLVGDLASIREGNVVGDRSIIGRLVMVEPNTRVGADVVIQTGSHITGDAVIEDGAYVGDEVSTSNDKHMGQGNDGYKGCHIKSGARIGSNSTLLPGVIIGENAVVAAGSVVARNVEPHTKVMGLRAVDVAIARGKQCPMCNEGKLDYRPEHHNYKCSECGHVDFRGYEEE